MNREIKFRFWDKEHKLFNNVPLMINPWGEIYTYSTNEQTGDMLCYVDKEILKELKFDKNNYILQQFTGLQDQNGTEIYEGDILRNIEPDGQLRISEVVFQDGRFGTLRDAPFSETSLVRGFHAGFKKQVSYEIIGNIYGDPELLK